MAAPADPPLITTEPVSQTIFLGDAVTFLVSASGTPPISYQWFRNGTAVAGATTSALSFVTVASDDNAVFTVQVTNATKFVTSSPAVLAIDFGSPGPAQTNRLIEVSNVWSYNVNKVDLGTAWTAPGYPDGSWPAGGGLLYVEDSALPAAKTTPLPLTGGSLPTTCYFRTRFLNTITNAYSINLVANTVIDDGLVAYLNGGPAFSVGMPTNTPIGYNTNASRTVGNAVWEGPFDVRVTNLVAGTNVLAAEVHQSGAGSTDIVLGLTLDAIWQPRLRDSNAPVVVSVLPAPGAAVSALTQIEVQFDEGVRGVDATDLLVNGVPATNVTAAATNDYVFQFPQPTNGPVSVTWAPAHGITDRSGNSNAFVGTGFSYLLGQVSTATPLTFSNVRQSTDAAAGNTALRAVDGANATFSLTQNLPGSYWVAELARAYPVERVELVNRPAPDDKAMAGLRVRLYNLDDQVVFETGLTNPGSGGGAAINLPAGLCARSLWVGLPGTQTNGAGTYQVGLAEVRLLGSTNIPYGPSPVSVVTISNAVRVWQSSEYGGFPAQNAVDGDTSNFTHTGNFPDSYWMADLGKTVAITRVEIVNRNSCCDNRLAGLVLRIFDGASNSVDSAVLTNPGLGGTWTYSPPAGTLGHWLRVGLEGGQMNGGGNYYVTLAEARVFSGATNVLVPAGTLPVPVTNNLASFKRSYMVRLSQSIPAASNANDDNYSTETKTTMQTVDGYWEVDLGGTCAVYGVRTIGASGIGYRMTNTICRLFDEAHDPVFARKLSGGPDVFDTDVNGPYFARYVRVGLENKQRTDPAGGLEWYIGMREVEVFGRPTNNIGIRSFTASTNQVAPGQRVTLSWAVEDVQRVEIRPGLGSVGAYTGTNGIGSLTVTLTNSTEFILMATNPAGRFFSAVTVEVSSNSLPVRLNELVADNKYSLKDGNGDASDWAELRNPGDTGVNLAGWGLSDDPALPMKWVFPATNLAAHGSLIVFLSGSSAPFDPAGNVHANFRLEKNGGALLLTRSDGVTAADSISYPELDTDLSYGRDLEGNWTFLEPTPGLPNAAPSYAGWVKQLDWSHPRGFYETAFTLRLTNNSPGASVYFSLNGSVPTQPYMNALSITGTTMVRAQAVRPGYRPARAQTRTFIFINDVITSPVMNTAITQNSAYAPRMRPGLLALPAISLAIPSTLTYDEQEGSVEVLWPNNTDPVQENCGIYQYGGSWQTFAKKSITVAFRARYGANKLHVPLFNGFDHGVLAKTSFDKLELNGGNQDMIDRGFYMSDRFVQDSLLDMGSLNPHGRFVHVYLNGVYWGQYNCKEPLMESFLADYLGGSPEDYVSVKGNDNMGDSFVVGTPDAPNTQPWERVLSLRNTYQGVRPYLDVSHLVDFMLLWNYGDAESEFRACGPREAGSGFKFWINDPDGFLRTSALGANRISRNGPGDLFSGLVGEGHPDFKALVADCVYRHFFNQGALTPAALDARLAARMLEVHDSLLAECARWGYRTPANWESSAATIRSTLFPSRSSQLVGYLRSAGLYPAFDPPAFNQYGGLVTNGFVPVLSTSSGTIYYTMDGTDPRLAGGGISPQARVWTAGAVTITNDLTLNVRVRTAGGLWSALAQPAYLIASRRPPSTRDLLITEVNYNPPGSDEFEFVELYNASTNLLDLSGVSLSNAVRFIFPNGYALPPGTFVMVVENAASFASRYQDPASAYYFPGLAVAGEWAGALDNAGETISLVASNGTELSSVPYRAGGDWPERADGQGSSIELRVLPAATNSDLQVRAYLADGRNWTSSSLYNGSPGRFDSFVKSVRINEILAHTDLGVDWLELLNTGTDPVDLAGCTLTDNIDYSAQWTFPTNSALLPGQFKVISVAQLPFAFSELGDRAFLLQVAGTNVIRFLDSVDFPAVEREESFGLFQRADGVLDFTELRANTPGFANALPRVGPVVISEIMFAPGAGRAEFIELANLTSAPVPLYDMAYPTNVWRLEGVGPFEFPPGTVLGPCSTLIVCSTNAASFRAQYAVGGSVPVLGPWTGALDDDGETLKLLRPGTPEPDGTVPYYRVDHVSYRTNYPWPQTLAGMSLERIPIESYGNDPADWRAGPLNGSPGVPAENRAPVITLTGNPVVPQQMPLTLEVSVADLDVPWQSVALTPVQLPAGSTFDPALGRLSWTPSIGQGPGQYYAEFAAVDTAACGAMPVTLQFAIQVTEPLAITFQTLPGGLMQLSFPALPGEDYFLDYCADLTVADWLPVQESGPATSNTVIFSGLQIGQYGIGYYRVRWVR